MNQIGLRVALSFFVLLPVVATLTQKKAAAQFAGPSEQGFLLPNGWRLTPAGQQVLLTDLPLNIWPTPDGKYALVATSGYNAHELTVVELATQKKGATQTVRQSWFGLTADAAGGKLWWSGAAMRWCIRSPG
jgi:hypothetical protein